MKEEALKLADFIEKHMVEFGLILGEVSRDHIVGTIRKLVAELDKQGEPVFEESNEQVVNAFYKQFPEMKPQTKPLSDEEIIDTFIKDGIYDCINDPYMQSDGKYSLDGDLIRFARAIEERHGIK